jgi:hypothetical protein
MASNALLKFKRLAHQSGELRRVREHGPWVLPAATALEIIDSMAGELLAVVGGDLWAQTGSGIDIKGDWYCEKVANEAPDVYAGRSLAVATERLRTALRTEQLPSVDLVVKDAVTGEPLRSLGEG